MKILYCALAIDITRSHGGATHVAEVTNGLAALGHDLWVVGAGTRNTVAADHLHARVSLVPTPPALAWLMTPQVRRIVRDWRPDVVMERYYTFAGGGIVAAHAARLPSLLEVNAPVVDPPGSRKDRVDRLTGRMMRRWATQQCRWASRIVTPLATTVPATMRSKVVPLPWGANTARFDPEQYPHDSRTVAELRARYGIPDDARVIGFVGSFRPWHGAREAVRAFQTVRRSMPGVRLILVGDGPERESLQRESDAEGIRDIIFTGAVPYADVPMHLALCDVAVAPFVPSHHAPLQHFGFYWSPLKVFEAMAMGTPVVTTAVAPLTAIVDGAGLCVPEGDIPALAGALVEILSNTERRQTMGVVGRARVIEQYSWRAHCEHLDHLLRDMAARS